MTVVRELIGVYNADGGLRGELAYIWGKARGTAHCALCDVTHSPVRRKREWDRFVDGLGVRFDLLHVNELPADVAGLGLAPPYVLARTEVGLRPVLDADSLESAHGSVGDFASLLAGALRAGELVLPPAAGTSRA
jgi:hypothetical protein